jgi:hypothetical protein
VRSVAHTKTEIEEEGRDKKEERKKRKIEKELFQIRSSFLSFALFFVSNCVRKPA